MAPRWLAGGRAANEPNKGRRPPTLQSSKIAEALIRGRPRLQADIGLPSHWTAKRRLTGELPWAHGKEADGRSERAPASASNCSGGSVFLLEFPRRPHSAGWIARQYPVATGLAKKAPKTRKPRRGRGFRKSVSLISAGGDKLSKPFPDRHRKLLSARNVLTGMVNRT